MGSQTITERLSKQSTQNLFSTFGLNLRLNGCRLIELFALAKGVSLEGQWVPNNYQQTGLAVFQRVYSQLGTGTRRTGSGRLVLGSRK
jgi:hypothetical protein